MNLYPPIRFRYAEEDREQYGDQWWTYDESAMLRAPARELVDVERQTGLTIRDMLGRLRAGYTDATLAATWTARRLAGVVEDFADYSPLALLIDWERLPAGDVNPPAPTSSPSPGEG